MTPYPLYMFNQAENQRSTRKLTAFCHHRRTRGPMTTWTFVDNSELMCALLDSIPKEIVSVVSRITDLVGITAKTRSVVSASLERALGILVLW